MNKLSWSQVIVVNISILTFAAYVVIQGSLKAPTSTGTTAAAPVQNPSRMPIYPINPPQIEKLEYWYGKPGDQVRIRGNYFGSARFASALLIGDVLVPSDNILSWSDTIIDFTIPQEAQTGNVNLLINNQPAIGPILSVYRNINDPLLQFTSNSEGTALELLHAPPTPLILSINNKTYSLNPNSPVVRVADFPQKFVIESASLQDNNGEFLPLYQHPLDLLP